MDRRVTSTVMTHFDYHRLERLLELLRERLDSNRENVDALEDELGRARVVPSEDIPPDVVTMNSAVELLDIDSRRRRSVALVFPGMAAAETGQISVLAPVGLALLGCREGQIVELPAPGGTRRYRIERVAYQPEAVGRFDL